MFLFREQTPFSVLVESVSSDVLSGGNGYCRCYHRYKGNHKKILQNTPLLWHCRRHDSDHKQLMLSPLTAMKSSNTHLQRCRMQMTLSISQTSVFHVSSLRLTSSYRRLRQLCYCHRDSDPADSQKKRHQNHSDRESGKKGKTILTKKTNKTKL